MQGNCDALFAVLADYCYLSSFTADTNKHTADISAAVDI
jgi:hypothetical protein